MLETARFLYESHKFISIQLFALEHRFYGESFPFQNSTVSNLKYLNSRQATADLAHFIQHQERSSSTIVFGGSYPGMVAAFARLKYPNLIDGAVSNSAPVQARLDFGAYNGHVGRIVPKSCQSILQTGHAELAVNYSAHVHLFPLCNTSQLDHRRNLELWLGDGVVELGAQGNDPACTESAFCNLESKCDLLSAAYNNNGNDSVAALAHLAQLEANGSCIDLDWPRFVEMVTDPMMNGLRSWIWQTCTEFGFYQTCNDPDCPYAQGYHSLDQDLELCASAFPGVPLPSEEMIADTNEWSGGWWMKGDRILSLTGTIDPWTELAAQTQLSVQGASHHFWTHQVQTTDSPAVQDARELVRQVVSTWVLPGYQSTEAA